MTTTRILAGAMSGTSADGVDIAITQIQGVGLEMTAKLLHHYHKPYHADLRAAIFQMRNSGHTDLRELARVGWEISLIYAAAVNSAIAAAGLKPSDLTAIAAHGQTLFHEVPLTIQYFDPSLVAFHTNLPVVSDFRRADLAAGGQGAPLVPFADYLLFRHPTKSRILLNLGGIANLTYLKPGGTPEEIIAFDTGPANCISDHICRTHGDFDQHCDFDGAGASQGRVIANAVREFLEAPYFNRKPPKSTDGPEMIALFENALPPGQHELNDLLATASVLTAATIQKAVATLNIPPVDEAIVSGGGIYNKAMMTNLSFVFPQIISAKSLDILPDAKEALAFALLGAATLDNLPSNLPSVTGAHRPVILGSITPKP